MARFAAAAAITTLREPLLTPSPRPAALASRRAGGAEAADLDDRAPGPEAARRDRAAHSLAQSRVGDLLHRLAALADQEAGIMAPLGVEAGDEGVEGVDPVDEALLDQEAE